MSESESSSPDRRPTLLLMWLKLMRLPTVFTALADILCGFLISRASEGGLKIGEVLRAPELAWLLVSSAGLYLGGMVLNDVFDARLDTVERPERPIPSGRISKTAASVLGNILLLLGITTAFLAGHVSGTGSGSLRIALGLAVAVVLYDALLKSTLVGPLGMGICRFLNIMLGASTSRPWPDNWNGPQLAVALALGIYIVGVTWFARNEAGNASKSSMSCGVVIILFGIGIDAWLATSGGFPASVVTGTLIALGVIAANVAVRGYRAIRDPVPRRVQQTVGLMLLSIIFLDAGMVFLVTGDGSLASLVVILVIPAVLMKRVIPLS